MLRWIDELEKIARSQEGRFPRAQDRQAVLVLYEEARKVFRRLLNSDAE